MHTTESLPAIVRPRSIAGLGRNRLVLGGAALGAIVAGAAWQWSWLVALGVAPLLLSAAPCVAMCGLGLCMHRLGGRACGTAAQGGQPVPTNPASSIRET